MRIKPKQGRRKLKIEYNLDEWEPKTKVGSLVKAGEITTIAQIWDMGKVILEPEIVDYLIREMWQEVIEIRNTQRMTDCGRKMSFRVSVLVGDENGYVGLGAGKHDEVRPAIESAIRQAKLNLVHVRLGSGSWEDTTGNKNSIPIKIAGQCGSVKVTLKPAPRGIGLAGNDIVKKVLSLAGVKDIWSSARGHTANVFNTASATIDALDKLNKVKGISSAYCNSKCDAKDDKDDKDDSDHKKMVVSG